MSEVQSLANQLGWCITTKDHLEGLISEINYVSTQYANMVEMLRSQGLMGEMLSQVEQMHSVYQQDAEALARHIGQDHLPYIEGRSQSVQRALEDVG